MIIARMLFKSPGCVGICAISADDKSHPNKLPFQGVLLILDKPSNKPPHGAEGHRIQVPTAVAKKRLSTLISMGVNYNPALDGHAVRHKVGVITGAWIEDGKVYVKGFLWKKDFPEVSRDMKAGRLGMSMELSDVLVRTKNEDPWILEDFHFSGATILFKSAAAYYNTSLAASGRKLVAGRSNGEKHKNQTVLAARKAALVREEGGHMATEKVKGKVKAAGSGQGALLVRAISTAVKEGFAPFASLLEHHQETLEGLTASFEELKGLTIAASAEVDDEVEEQEDKEKKEVRDKVEAAEDDDDEGDGEGKKGKKDEDDDEDDDADLEAELEHLEDDAADEEPGEVNEDAKNEGDKTTPKASTSGGKAKHMPIKAKGIAASALVRDLYAQNRTMRKTVKSMKAEAKELQETMQNKIDALEAQVEQYAEKVDRKSVSPELSTFLAKGGVDVRELRAEGRKISVEEVDAIFAAAPVQLDPTTRMWFKNQMLEAGMMEQGEIHRGI